MGSDDWYEVPTQSLSRLTDYIRERFPDAHVTEEIVAVMEGKPEVTLQILYQNEVIKLYLVTFKERPGYTSIAMVSPKPRRVEHRCVYEYVVAFLDTYNTHYR